MAKRTMRALDEMPLTPADDMPPEKTRALRLRENAGQAVFARHLNVTTSLVSQWEQGEKRPRAASLKLPTLVAKKGRSAVLFCHSLMTFLRLSQYHPPVCCAAHPMSLPCAASRLY